MHTLSPTFAIWMDAFCDLVAIMIKYWMVLLVWMTRGFFGLLCVGEFEILTGCLPYSTGPFLAPTKHVPYLMPTELILEARCRQEQRVSSCGGF